jgi:hypothetical protein
MSYAAIAEAIHVYVDTAAQAGSSNAHPSMRPAGTPTPIAVYEHTVEPTMFFPGEYGAKPHYNVTATIACIADTVQAAVALASDIADYIDSNPNYADPGSAINIKCTALSFTLSAEQPDDGQQDAERTVTITATIQARET